MASRTTVALIDDVDGGTADETVSFALDGVEYDIDLSSGNAESLRNALAEFVIVARRTSNRGAVFAGKTRIRADGDKAQNRAIRDWARQQGHQISERGRISSDLIVKFQQAHKN